jgi:hypothetical protein
VGHRLDGVRRRARCARDADVVERNDTAIRGKRVDEGWIPVVEVPAEVLQRDERDIALANVAVCVLDPVLGGDPLRGGVGVSARRIGLG